MKIKFLLLIIITASIVFGQPYPDQYYSYQKDSLNDKG